MTKPYIRENEVKKLVIDLLNLYANKGKGFYIRNNSGLIKTDKGAYVKTGLVGSSDLIWFGSRGNVVFIELKSSIGKQSIDQRMFEEMVNSLGYKYIIICGNTAQDLLALERNIHLNT